ncbi:hypothetical protein LINPERPRIM_LOCUS19611 [Linum perenne]
MWIFTFEFLLPWRRNSSRFSHQCHNRGPLALRLGPSTIFFTLTLGDRSISVKFN